MNNSSMKEKIRIATIGAIMGIAEAIPGVSGGTIAFVFKIYHELLETIKSFTLSSLSLLLKAKFAQFFERINGGFLLVLGMGMVIGIIVGVFGISYLIEHQKEALWAFFFGLVLASSIYLSRDVSWKWTLSVVFILGVLISYFITLLTPTSGSTNPLFIFICGAIAISALMLPGLSGSFILLLMGMYTTIIGSLKNLISHPELGKDLWTILIFGSGCILGLFAFSRFLSYIFKKFYNSTMVFMIGILIGSLNKLWPWKIVTKVVDKKSGEVMAVENAGSIDIEKLKILEESNVLPFQYSTLHDPNTLSVCLAFLLGMVLIAIIYFYDSKPSLPVSRTNGS